ncbi:MAG: hypothetical protein J6C40_05635, partial [Lentisphaeria bacterium]|nr:hypothetical protein [Lentisphaeria bacterium]
GRTSASVVVGCRPVRGSRASGALSGRSIPKPLRKSVNVQFRAKLNKKTQPSFSERSAFFVTLL